MTTRVLSWIAIAVVGTILLCSGLATTLIFGGAGSGTCATAASAAPAASSAASAAAPTGAHSPGPGGIGPIGRWNAEQVGNAAIIVTVSMRLAVPPRGWVIAVATAMQESSLINTSGGDQDSIGLFQQRPSQGWGTPAQLHDPDYAASKFYEKLLTVDGWQAMPLTKAAQKVQRSAYPDAYAKWEPDAAQLVTTLTGASAGLGMCGVTISAEGWTQPVHGKVGSGFRTPERPTHDGVDLIVPKGTPIHGAAAGTVSRVRCNAIDVRTGGDWGCDRDGDPNLTRGCGWYVDIDHPGGIVTRYCHQLVQPYVHVGQQVNAGDVIGISGSSGHSSGSHVHYEVHLGDHSSATAVDPVAFMASVGAPLDQ
jgi:murein DD-endopeptidase MepM/ murein hydrolase activator NlpD